MAKKILLVLITVLLIIFLFLIFYRRVIFQEGSPWPQIRGIVELSLGRSEMVKLSETEKEFLTKSSEGRDMILNYMQKKGYEFIEQMGAGYVFLSSKGEKVVVTHRLYTKCYSIWKINE